MKNCNSCQEAYKEKLPGYDAPVVVGHGCGCDKKECCGCPEPIQEVIQPYSARPGLLRFNYGGHSVDYDFTNMVRMTQTDTSLSMNERDRTLVYSAERHVDEISAKDLGSILHIADIGDVDARHIEDGSLLVYRKNSNCADGCTGIDNVWRGWNAYDESSLKTSLNSVMGFDEGGEARSLNTPLHANQYYNFGWNGNGKLGYSQPVEVSTPPVDTNNKAYRLYLDPTTKQVVYVKEDA